MNIASIDIGTNTVLLLIAKLNYKKKSITPLLNEYRMPRIGKGLVAGGFMQRQKINELIHVLEEYLSIIKLNDCKIILTAATNALRIAANSNEIISEVNDKLNLKIQVIDGNKEAELTYLGTIHPNVSLENTIIDIGGGSTEIIYGKDGQIVFKKSFPIGVVSLTERFFKNDPPTQSEILKQMKFINTIFLNQFAVIPSNVSTIAVAGTPTSLAAIKNGLRSYEEKIVDNSFLNNSDLEEFINYFSRFTAQELYKQHPKILAGREDVILSGTLILSELSKLLGIKGVKVSTKGIRYGLMVELMNLIG